MEIGDPSRKVIEMIFQRASMNPSKPSSRIKTILRVHNSIQMVQRFEKYREKVKEMAYEMNIKYSRSKVDGNELLRFYGTTIACCDGNSSSSSLSKRVSDINLCKDNLCRVCRILQSNFETEHTLKNGIQLSTNSEKFSENNTFTITRMKKIRRAVIVCRAIAGTVMNMNSEEHKESSYSIDCNSECLTVPSPSAVLPCFVIVFT